jgi:hypothetical protein
MPLALALLLVACTDATPSPVDRSACSLAVIASDYRSTTVSLLASDGTLCAPDILTSGSRPPGLLTALSGDLVLPSEPFPDGHLGLIDRFPNGVLTTVDPATSEVLAQTRLSPDFAGNPQDVVAVPEGLLVSRLERASDTSDAPGSDLLLISPEGPRAIDLAPFASAGFDPMPTRFARAHGSLWVGLTHLARDWSVAGTGRILRLSQAPLAVVAAVDLDGLENCGHLAATSAGDALWVVCTGRFDASRSDITRAGVAVVDGPDESGASAPSGPAWIGRADALIGHPLGFAIAALDADRAFVIALGALEDGTPDALVLVDRRTGLATELAQGTGGPFELSGLHIEGGLLLLADANPRAPTLRRFRIPQSPGLTGETAGGFAELPAVVVSPTGLPPRQVGRLRP